MSLRLLPARATTDVVDPSDLTWSQLLAELSQLSKIVEQSANDRNHGFSSTTTLELEQAQHYLQSGAPSRCSLPKPIEPILQYHSCSIAVFHLGFPKACPA